MTSEYEYFGVETVANPDDTLLTCTWAKNVANRLRRNAEYMEENCYGLSNVEVDRIERLGNTITKYLMDHEERKTIFTRKDDFTTE